MSPQIAHCATVYPPTLYCVCLVEPAAVQLAVRLCLNMAKRRKSEHAPLARQKHIKEPYLVLNMI